MVSSKDSYRKVIEVQWVVALTLDTHRGSSPFNKKKKSNISDECVAEKEHINSLFSSVSPRLRNTVIKLWKDLCSLVWGNSSYSDCQSSNSCLITCDFQSEKGVSSSEMPAWGILSTSLQQNFL